MSSYQDKLDNLIQKLKQNMNRLLTTKEVPLSKASLPKSPGVYMIYFNGKLQYIGSSGNLKERIKTNLLSGDREAHTLISKLCTLKNWNIDKAHNFLKTAATIKFIETETEDDAKILEEVLIALYHPFYNMSLKIAKRFIEIEDYMISEEDKVKDLLTKIQDMIVYVRGHIILNIYG
jgi:excinuclease UvrABC nuclease subunit